MPDDTSLKSVFDYAKQGPLTGGDIPTLPAVFVTFVEHFPNSHPPGSSKDRADLVTYANGKLKLSQDKKSLSGELKLWRNTDYPGDPFSGASPDVFTDSVKDVTVVLTVSDAGQVTYQKKLKGKPTHAPFALNASYENGLFVEKSAAGLRSLSFTLGTTA